MPRPLKPRNCACPHRAGFSAVYKPAGMPLKDMEIKRDRMQGDLEPVIKRLRDEGFSWRRVSKYLAENQNFDSNWRYFQKVFAGSKLSKKKSMLKAD